MTQQMILKLTDDMDGTEAEETIAFGLDGAGYEIDLNAKNAAALRKALERYVVRARRATEPARRARSNGRRPAGGGDVPAKAVREWALEQGLEVSTRGRVSAEIIDQYRAAVGA